MRRAGPVKIEEQGRMRCWPREGSERGRFQGPAMGIFKGRVGGGEELGEKWRVRGGAEPEGRGEGDVDFFEAAVRYVTHGFCEFQGKGRVEGCEISLKPAKGSCHNNLVECLGSYGGGGRNGNFGVLRMGDVVHERRGFCGEVKIGFGERRTGDASQN